jgi:hypothetical protein
MPDSHSEVQLEVQDAPASRQPSRSLLILLGALWLVLAAAIIVLQLGFPAPIRVEWQTETELNTAGFNVYRSTAAEGEFERLNAQLIPSQGGPTSGGSYIFLDDEVEAGQTYYYRLEDVEMDNRSEMHDLISFTAPGPAWWAPVAAVISVVAGLYLLRKGVQSHASD